MSSWAKVLSNFWLYYLKCSILPTIQNYSLLIKLKPHIRQLRMDRNSKKMNLAKRLIVTKKEHVSCNMILDMSFLTNANTVYTKHENPSNP